MNKADIAKKYASLGWPVFPLHSITESGRCSCRENCASPGKHPRTITGVKEATTDPLKINAWFQKWPDANIGIATGKASGLVVFDFDFKDGGMSFSNHWIDRAHSSSRPAAERLSIFSSIRARARSVTE